MDFWVFTNRIGLDGRPMATLEHDVSKYLFIKSKTEIRFKQIFSVGQARFQMR